MLGLDSISQAQLLCLLVSGNTPSGLDLGNLPSSILDPLISPRSTAREQQSIEWKEPQQEEHFNQKCGFANAQGGRIYIGKNNDGRVVGLPNIRKLLEDLPNQVRDLMGILVKVNRHEEGGLEYLEIIVEPCLYPISYRGKYHYRSGSTKQELKGPVLSALLL